MDEILKIFGDLGETTVPVIEIPLSTIIAVALILAFTQTFRQLFTSIIIKTVERFTSKTETTLDDELIAILKPSLNLLILLGGIWLVQVILAEYLSPQLTKAIQGFLNLATILTVAFIIYRTSALLGTFLASSVLRTDSELDDILRPFLPKIFQTIAIIVTALKVSEIFLGQSAAALVGLLGGAGLTLGLLFKDLIYDWFCTVIIYADGLYRAGDWIGVSGINGFVEVKEIGFRSTKLHIVPSGAILRMPNSRMITGIVENWSQNPGEELKWGLNLTLKIDGISAKKTEKICAAIREFPKNIDRMPKKIQVRFSNIEGNARVIKIRTFINDASLYYYTEEKLNLGILELLEREGIDNLDVKLEVDPEKYSKAMKAIDNLSASNMQN